ncbi:MAG: hypothetical protein WA144_05760 [Candidatus Methanoperedens sp.]
MIFEYTAKFAKSAKRSQISLKCHQNSPSQNPDFTIQEERLQYGAEKIKQRDTAHLIQASKPRKELSLKDSEVQTAEIVIPNKVTASIQ